MVPHFKLFYICSVTGLSQSSANICHALGLPQAHPYDAMHLANMLSQEVTDCRCKLTRQLFPWQGHWAAWDMICLRLTYFTYGGEFYEHRKGAAVCLLYCWERHSWRTPCHPEQHTIIIQIHYGDADGWLPSFLWHIAPEEKGWQTKCHCLQVASTHRWMLQLPIPPFISRQEQICQVP